MTSAQMNARVRTLLNEVSQDFWTDTVDIYPALAIAQQEIIKLLAKKQSSVLLPLLQKHSPTDISGTSTALPSGFFVEYSIKGSSVGGTQKSLHPRSEDRYKDEDNPYLSSEEGYIYYRMFGSNIEFDITFSHGTLTMDYLKVPSDISSSTEPTIGVEAHPSIVYYAFWYLLGKITRNDPNIIQAQQNAMNMFNTSMAGL